MKKVIFLWLFCFQICSASSPYWSKTGHRVTGEIAQEYLSRKARKAISRLLEGQSLAEVSNYADEIKSDDRYREFYPWHYVNLPLDKEYKDVEPNPSGDIITGIQKCIAVLENENSNRADKVFYLKMLVHFLGDLHQPMHVGKKSDKGGNDFQLLWFNTGTNLHKVWDYHLIEDYGMSYTELANKLPRLSKSEVKKIQHGDVYKWVKETHQITNDVYGGVEMGEKLGYRYSYKYWPTVERQLLVGGLRLAGLLNTIFG
ncbi:MAG: S1/P1 nuclease [Flavobacteriaceae bacterium]